MYEDVDFEYDKTFQAMIEAGYSEHIIDKELEFTVNKFNSLKETDELFQIKRFIPSELRSGFYNFLKFSSEAEKNVYESSRSQCIDI